jgi:hypothetical protein
MTELPDTRYARSGDFALAYQVLGEGAADILCAPGFASNVEGNWMAPDTRASNALWPRSSAFS